MKLRSGISDDKCMDLFDAKIIKNAVLSALDLQKTPNVQHFAPKKTTVQHFFPVLVFSPGRCCDAKTQKSYSPTVRAIQQNVQNRLPLSE